MSRKSLKSDSSLGASPKSILTKQIPDNLLGETVDFLGSLEDRLYFIENTVTSRRDLARECFQILQKLVRRETKVYALKDGIDTLCAEFAAEEWVERLLHSIYNKISAELHASFDKSFDLHFHPTSLIVDFKQIFAWYIRRKASLLSLAEYDLENANQTNAIFNIRVNHDRKYSKVSCLEFLASARILGHRHESLWFKLGAFYQGQAVKVRNEWQLWIDEASRFIHNDADSNLQAMNNVACVVPVISDRQKLIVDNLVAYIPYEVFDLEPGKKQLEIKAGIYNQAGQEISVVEVFEDVFIPESEFHNKPIPSPQSLGLWSRDVVTSDAISNVRLSQQDEIQLRFDLDLFGHELDSQNGSTSHLNVQQDVYVQCRFIDSTGSIVKSRSRYFADNDSCFIASLRLSPVSPAQSFSDLAFNIPKAALDLEAGTYGLICELVVVLSNGKVICGAVERFEFNQIEMQRDLPLPLFVAGNDLRTGINIDLPSLSTNYQFNSLNLIELKVLINSANWQHNPCRLNLEVYAGQYFLNSVAQIKHLKELQQTLFVGGSADKGRQDLRFVLQASKIRQALSSQDPNWSLIFRLTLVDNTGRLIYESSQGLPLYMLPVEDQAEKSQDIAADFGRCENLKIVAIDQLQLNQLNQRLNSPADNSQLYFAVTLHAKSSQNKFDNEKQYCLSCEIISPNHETIKVYGADSAWTYHKNLNIESIFNCEEYKNESFQHIVNINVDLNLFRDMILSQTCSLAIKLLDPDGNVLQTVSKSLSKIDLPAVTNRLSSVPVSLSTDHNLDRVENTQLNSDTQQAIESVRNEQVLRPTDVAADYGVRINDPKVVVGDLFLTLNYEVFAVSELPQEFILKINFIDEKNQLILDRYATHKIDDIHESYPKSKLCFQRIISVGPDKKSSLVGQLKIELDRFLLRAGNRKLFVELIVSDAFGEELTSSEIQFAAEIPQIEAGFFKRVVDWMIAA